MWVCYAAVAAVEWAGSGPGGSDTPYRSLLRWLTQEAPEARPTADMALAHDVARPLFTPSAPTRSLALPPTAFGLDPVRTGHVASLPVAAAGAPSVGGAAADGSGGAGAGGALLTASVVTGGVA
jgi:hypothetical protein